MEAPLWYRVFSEREVKEIQLALQYKEFYNHGTSGHMEYTVIAKFAKLLEELEITSQQNVKVDEDYLKRFLELLFGGK